MPPSGDALAESEGGAGLRTQAASVFSIGFFLYGPQMLIGLCGAEIVGRKSVGASEGFLGWVAYLGAANAGAPLSILVRQFGWNAFFMELVGKLEPAHTGNAARRRACARQTAAVGVPSWAFPSPTSH